MVLSNDIKKAIAFGLIIGAIISICNLCFAAEMVSGNEIHGYALSINGLISTNASGVIIQFPLEPNATYTLVNNGTSSYKHFGFSNSSTIAANDYLEDTQRIDKGKTFTFTTEEYSYLYLYGFNYVNDIILYREGMGGFVENLAYDLSFANLNGVVTFVVPIMAISILVALGLYLLKRLLNRIKRAKGGV